MNNRYATKRPLHNKHFAPRAVRLLVAALLLTVFSVPAAHAAVSDESDVRSAVEQAFQQLRGGDYSALYDVLPTASQRRVPRDQFVRALERSRNLYDLDRLEIGTVRVAGDLALVDTIIYARARKPFEAEGKIVARQYLVREGGRWRVTTGERATINPLLAANPAFAKRYPPTEPRVYLKRDGKWVDIRTVFKNTRRPPAK